MDAIIRFVLKLLAATLAIFGFFWVLGAVGLGAANVQLAKTSLFLATLVGVLWTLRKGQ